jgi:hypothetical protein
MPLNEGFIGEGLRDDSHREVSGATARAGMAGVEVTVVADFQFQRLQFRGELFPHSQHTFRL